MSTKALVDKSTARYMIYSNGDLKTTQYLERTWKAIYLVNDDAMICMVFKVSEADGRELGCAFQQLWIRSQSSSVHSTDSGLRGRIRWTILQRIAVGEVR